MTSGEILSISIFKRFHLSLLSLRCPPPQVPSDRRPFFGSLWRKVGSHALEPLRQLLIVIYKKGSIWEQRKCFSLPMNSKHNFEACHEGFWLKNVCHVGFSCFGNPRPFLDVCLLMIIVDCFMASIHQNVGISMDSNIIWIK